MHFNTTTLQRRATNVKWLVATTGFCRQQNDIPKVYVHRISTCRQCNPMAFFLLSEFLIGLHPLRSAPSQKLQFIIRFHMQAGSNNRVVVFHMQAGPSNGVVPTVYIYIICSVQTKRIVKFLLFYSLISAKQNKTKQTWTSLCHFTAITIAKTKSL